MTDHDHTIVDDSQPRQCVCLADDDVLSQPCDEQSRQELIAENTRLRRAMIRAEAWIAAELLRNRVTLDTKRHPEIVAIDVALGRTPA